MHSDRWPLVKELVKRALELPEAERKAFLDDVCTNAATRREVDSLLSVQDDGFLDEPVLSLVDENLIGRRLSHYVVLEELGRGGMGVVYRARDERLDREVALKLLPRELVVGPERLHRFVKEAKAAAGLAHPNIAVVHEIDEHEGVTFIAMELVRGESLADILERERLPVTECVRIGIEIARGLSSAHENQIVHRDLKPGNVMRSDNGRIKLIDFSLAKLLTDRDDVPIVEGDPDAGARSMTRTGQLMGTPRYMAPEQAMGTPVDARTDLFALGVLLFQMLYGKHPFGGSSDEEALRGIVEGTPEFPRTGSRTDRRLAHVIRKCLEKMKDDRYVSAHDLLEELIPIQQAVDGRGLRRRAQWAGAAALTGLVAIVIAKARPDRDAPPSAIQLMNPVQITSALALENFPDWSPDGRSITYESKQGPSIDIWVVDADGGAPRNLTGDWPGHDRYATWTPDGRHITFWSDREGEGFFNVPASGGPARKMASTERSGRGHWSPDGAEFTYLVVRDEEVVFETLEPESGVTRRFPAPGESVRRVHPAWTHDGRLVAYMDAPYYNSAVHPLLLVRTTDRNHFRITDGSTRIFDASFSPDERSLFFVSNRGGVQDLWRQLLARDGEPIGEPTRVTQGLRLRSVAISPDGRKIAYSEGRRFSNIWSTPIGAPDDRWEKAIQLTFDHAFIGTVSLARDGKTIFFSSDRNGSLDIWSAPVKGGEPTAITTDSASDFAPIPSPDGETVAFYSNRSGNRDVWTIPRAGGVARQITFHEADDYHPDFSPDGRTIAFVSTRSGNRDIWLVPATGGEPRPVASHPSMDQFPKWSPDGKTLVFESHREGKFRLWLVEVDTGTTRPLTEEIGRAVYPRWSPDGAHVYYTGLQGNIWRVGVEAGKSQRLTNLQERPGALGGLALATDGETLYFAWEQDLGDIWVADLTSP